MRSLFLNYEPTYFGNSRKHLMDCNLFNIGVGLNDHVQDDKVRTT